jgi:hypothetical protein
VGWLKKDLLRTRVLNPKALTEAQKSQLLEVYNRWKTEQFPSLLDQLRTHYPGRLAIDSAVAPLVGIETSNEYLNQLQETVAERLGWMKDLMSRE